MKKLVKKIAIIFCMVSLGTPSNMGAKTPSDIIIKSLNASSIGKKYGRMFIEARNDKSLCGYTVKKGENNAKSNFVTGKIELVPINVEYYYDWMRIVDCSSEENREYLKYWVHSYKDLCNKKMKEHFYTMIADSVAPIPDCCDYMIKFYEYDGVPITEKEIKNSKIKFKEPKIVGHISIAERDNTLLSGYVIDKNFKGKGIATKALKLILELSLKLYKNGFSPYKYISLNINNRNIGSMTVAKNCGFIDEGISLSCDSSCDGEVHSWVRELDLDYENPEEMGAPLSYDLLCNRGDDAWVGRLGLEKSDSEIKEHDDKIRRTEIWCLILSIIALESYFKKVGNHYNKSDKNQDNPLGHVLKKFIKRKFSKVD